MIVGGVEAQIERRANLCVRLNSRRNAGARPRGGCGLQREDGGDRLESLSFRQFAQDARERRLLVVQRVEDERSVRGEIFKNRDVPSRVAGQRQEMHAVAAQAGQTGGRLTRDRCADAERFLRRQALQDIAVRCEEKCVRGQSYFFAERQQSCAQCIGHRSRRGKAFERCVVIAQVGRQFQRWGKRGEPCCPVLRVLLARLSDVHEALLLDERAERRDGRQAVINADGTPVVRQNVFVYHTKRPAIAHGMMRDDQQLMAGGTEREQLKADQRSEVQRKDAVDDTVAIRVDRSVGGAAKVDSGDGEARVVGRQKALRAAVGLEHRAQRLMTRQHVAHR